MKRHPVNQRCPEEFKCPGKQHKAHQHADAVVPKLVFLEKNLEARFDKSYRHRLRNVESADENELVDIAVSGGFQIFGAKLPRK